MTVFITPNGGHINCDDGRHLVNDMRRARDEERDEDEPTVTLTARELEEIVAKAVAKALNFRKAGEDEVDEDDDAEALGARRAPRPGPLLSGRDAMGKARRINLDRARRAHDSAPADYDFGGIMQRAPW